MEFLDFMPANNFLNTKAFRTFFQLHSKSTPDELKNKRLPDKKNVNQEDLYLALKSHEKYFWCCSLHVCLQKRKQSLYLVC